MQLKEIKLAVGPARFQEAAMLAQAAAADTGISMPPQEPILWQLPQEVAALIWDNPLSVSKKLDQLFSVYRELPTYSLLNYVGEQFESLDENEQSQLWHHCIQVLDDEKRWYARPMEYFIWCDFFERGDRVDDSWEALVTAGTPHLALQSILLISGPVPVDLKSNLYQRLLPNAQWHHWIFLSILHSYSEANGQFSEEDATKYLPQLLIPRSTPNLIELQRALGIKPSLRVL